MYYVASYPFTTRQAAESFARDMSESTGLSVRVQYYANAESEG